MLSHCFACTERNRNNCHQRSFNTRYTTRYSTAKIFFNQPILCYWSLSIPLKTSENLWFSDVFGGYRKRSVAWHELKNLWVPTLLFPYHPTWNFHISLVIFDFHLRWLIDQNNDRIVYSISASKSKTYKWNGKCDSEMRSYGPFKLLMGNNVSCLFLTSERGKKKFFTLQLRTCS